MTDRPGPTVPAAPVVVRDGVARRASDAVATEEPLEIRVEAPGVRERSIAVTMRTPGHDFELAAGFLVSEGVLRSREDLDRVRYCVGGPAEQQFNVVTVTLRASARFDPDLLSRNVYTSSSCGVCGKASLEALSLVPCPPPPAGPVVAGVTLSSMPETLRRDQPVFDRTGGLHAAGLFEPDGTLLLAREDVGRHNAVDKLVGALLLADGLPSGERVLVVSGRASFEIMQKALGAGIPFVAAVGAPSSLAVDVAAERGMTLAGFVREGSFNLYAGSQRVRLSDADAPKGASGWTGSNT